MSPKKPPPRHRKPRSRALRRNAPTRSGRRPGPGRTALRAGVASGVLSTLAVTAGAAPSPTAGPDSAPATKTVAEAERPTSFSTLASDVPAAAGRNADALQSAAFRYQVADARAEAREQAAEDARRRAEARERRAAEAKEARERDRATRTAARTELGTGNVTRLVDFLRAQVGKPYVLGATGPGSYDCSGLVRTAFRQIGVELPRTSQEQSTAGTPIEVGAARAGDLVFWGGVGSAYHVAVHLGGGQYLDAANPSKGVVVQDLSYSPPSSAVRVL